MRELTSGIVVFAAAVASAGPHAGPASPQQGRAWKALHKEFEEKVRPNEAAVRAAAKKIIVALQKGDLDVLVEDAVMYSPGKDRKKLTRAWFDEHLPAVQAAVKQVDVAAPDFAEHLDFEPPEPGAGMPAKVRVAFGPKVERPAEDKQGRRFPARHALELYWCGPHMPEANGPVHEFPLPGFKAPRWRLGDVVFPYSRQPVMRL